MTTYTATVLYAHDKETANKLINAARKLGDNVTEGITDLDGSIELVLERKEPLCYTAIAEVKYFLAGYQFALTEMKAGVI
jgi:hypothetical protein